MSQNIWLIVYARQNDMFCDVEKNHKNENNIYLYYISLFLIL